MAATLYLGNLSFNITEAELKTVLQNLDIPVRLVRVVRDPETGKSKGFGFVELAPGADPEHVIRELKGKVIDGRAVTVDRAEP